MEEQVLTGLACTCGSYSYCGRRGATGSDACTGRCRTGEQHRKTRTRRGFYTVESSLEPWSGSVRTVLERDGMFRVYTGSRERG
jgi:hypothetical protein